MLQSTPQIDIQEDRLPDPWMTTENDLPWLIYLGKKRYGKQYDYTTVEGWYRNIVLKSPLMFHSARTKNAFCISMISTLPWIPSEMESNVVFICADDGAMWEGMKLLRDSIEWSKGRKCARWRVCSNTEYDLTAMAKRLGATEIQPRYSMEL